MSTPAIEESQLQLLFDGELPAAEAEAVKRAVEADPELRRRYDQLERLRRVFTTHTAQAVQQADFEAMFARIQSGIEADAEPIDHDAQSRAGAAAHHGSTLPWWRRTWHAMLEGRSPMWMPAAGTVAVAAAVLLMVYTQEEPAPMAAHRAPRDNDPAALAGPSAAAWSHHSEVVAVDFGESTGTVFEIDLADGVSAPVVWINDD